MVPQAKKRSCTFIAALEPPDIPSPSAWGSGMLWGTKDPLVSLPAPGHCPVSVKGQRCWMGQLGPQDVLYLFPRDLGFVSMGFLLHPAFPVLPQCLLP